jgi:CBS domain containing-hemolysin-like protein
MLSRLQKIPAAGDCFHYEGRQFKVEEMDGRRIARVKIEMVQPAMKSGD